MKSNWASGRLPVLSTGISSLELSREATLCDAGRYITRGSRYQERKYNHNNNKQQQQKQMKICVYLTRVAVTCRFYPYPSRLLWYDCLSARDATLWDMGTYRQLSNIRCILVGNCWSLRCSWSIACRRCFNYIFILHLTRGFNILCKDNCKPRQESFEIWCDLY